MWGMQKKPGREQAAAHNFRLKGSLSKRARCYQIPLERFGSLLEGRLKFDPATLLMRMFGNSLPMFRPKIAETMWHPKPLMDCRRPIPEAYSELCCSGWHILYFDHYSWR